MKVVMVPWWHSRDEASRVRNFLARLDLILSCLTSHDGQQIEALLLAEWRINHKINEMMDFSRKLQ